MSVLSLPVRASMVLLALCAPAAASSAIPAGFGERSADVNGTDEKGVAIAGSGHWLMEEAPGQVIPQLVAFLDASR